MAKDKIITPGKSTPTFLCLTGEPIKEHKGHMDYGQLIKATTLTICTFQKLKKLHFPLSLLKNKLFKLDLLINNYILFFTLYWIT